MRLLRVFKKKMFVNTKIKFSGHDYVHIKRIIARIFLFTQIQFHITTKFQKNDSLFQLIVFKIKF